MTNEHFSCENFACERRERNSREKGCAGSALSDSMVLYLCDTVSEARSTYRYNDDSWVATQD